MEDFRAKNIGQPTQQQVRDNFRSLYDFRSEVKKYERERFERLKGRLYRPISGVQISDDHGKSWKLRALCDECVRSIEPPTRCKKNGGAAVQTCDWCGALNETYQK